MSPFDFELSQQSKPGILPRLAAVLFLQAHDLGHFPILRHLSDLSRVNFTRGTDRDSEQFAPVARISPPPTRPARRRTRPQSHKVTLHAITFFPPPSLASLWITERRKNRRFDNGAKTPFVASSSRIRSLQCTHTLPLPPPRPLSSLDTRKSGSLSPRVIVICFRNYGLPWMTRLKNRTSFVCIRICLNAQVGRRNFCSRSCLSNGIFNVIEDMINDEGRRYEVIYI